MIKATLSAAAVLVAFGIATGQAQERYASAAPMLSADTGVLSAAPLPNLQAQHRRRLTWSEITKRIPPIAGILPNGISENGYN